MWRFAHVRPAVALWRFALARRARVHDSLKGLWEWLIQFGVVLLFVVWLITICVTGECHDTQTEVFLCSRNLYYSFDKKPRHLSTKSRSLTFFCRYAVLRFPLSIVSRGDSSTNYISGDNFSAGYSAPIFVKLQKNSVTFAFSWMRNDWGTKNCRLC